MGGGTFRRIHLLSRSSGEVSLFVQQQECSHPQILLPQQLYALLGCGSVFHHNIVQGTTRCADGDVILLVDGTQVS